MNEQEICPQCQKVIGSSVVTREYEHLYCRCNWLPVEITFTAPIARWKTKAYICTPFPPERAEVPQIFRDAFSDEELSL